MEYIFRKPRYGKGEEHEYTKREERATPRSTYSGGRSAFLRGVAGSASWSAPENLLAAALGTQPTPDTDVLESGSSSSRPCGSSFRGSFSLSSHGLSLVRILPDAMPPLAAKALRLFAAAQQKFSQWQRGHKLNTPNSYPVTLVMRFIHS